MSPKRPEIDAILQEFVDRRAAGESPSTDEWVSRYPQFAAELRAYFATLETLDRCVVGRGLTPPAETVLGDFRIVRELGRGGMGVVFLAEQVSLRRLVALKLLGSATSQRYDTVERFRREAEIAARLHHPNLVSVYAVGERQGYCFFAMEFVEGVTLARLLARLREFGAERLGEVDVAAIVSEISGSAPEVPDGTPPPTPVRHLGYFGTVARIVAELADGLAYAHSRGVIHRDVKPANVLLRGDLVPQLADFGIARDIGQKTLSLTGDLVGTPYYMSPELAMAGRIPVDHRTDIYSLGVTLFEMLALAVPFPGSSSAEVLRKILLEPTPSPRRFNARIPRDLQVIALKAMEKDPAHRYPTASDMAEDLRRFLRFEPILARAPGPVRIAARFVKRHRAVFGVASVVLLGGAVAGRITARSFEQERRSQVLTLVEDLQRESPEDAPENWLLSVRQLSALASEDRDQPVIEARLRETRARIKVARDELVEAAALRMEWPTARAQNAIAAARSLDIAARLIDGDVSAEEAASIRNQRDIAYGVYPVTIATDPPAVAASVSVRSIDPESDEMASRNSVGAAPASILLPGGWYSIVVEAPGVGFAEVEWLVTRDAATWQVHAPIRSTEQAVAGMIAIPAGSYRVGRGLQPGVPVSLELPEQNVDLEAFWLDRTEVSNDEYARFLRETHRKAPRGWNGTNPPHDGMDRLPVVNVTWDDANAYARWAGKRLPTEREWEAACRGPEGLLFGYGDAYVAGVERVPVKGAPELASRPVDVDSMPGAKSPFGVLHLVGNVQEWTGDWWRPRPDSLVLAPELATKGERVVRGSAFGGRDFEGDCSCLSRNKQLATIPTVRVGFRCAKSVQP
jgi:serine/threonine protein kinase/formylglycine-generating enzyme required for sulfatase activity